MHGNPGQVGIQAAAVLTAIVYSGVMSFILLKLISLFIPLRATAADEATGLDVTMHGEEAYLHGERNTRVGRHRRLNKRCADFERPPRVLVLESRRARELATLVTTYGGEPISAPSMREVPLESNTEALAFADGLERGEFDLVILLTGVGTRALIASVEHVRGSRDSFVDALRRTKIVARGPKPVAVLREMQVPVWLTAPEPNTWREILSALDSRRSELSLRGFALPFRSTASPTRICWLGFATAGPS